MFMLRLWRGRTKTLLASLLLALPLAAGAQELARQPASVDVERPEPYKLGPGDVLHVFVWRQPTLSDALSVAPDGTINYPLMSSIN